MRYVFLQLQQLYFAFHHFFGVDLTFYFVGDPFFSFLLRKLNYPTLSYFGAAYTWYAPTPGPSKMDPIKLSFFYKSDFILQGVREGVKKNH